MFLSLFTERERELFYTLSCYLVECDGIITGEEKTLIESFKVECSDQILEKIDETPNEIINELSLSDDRIKNCILLELISVALVDNHYTENEKCIISKVVENFNISEQKFEEIFNWVVGLKEMYSKIVQLVEI